MIGGTLLRAPVIEGPDLPRSCSRKGSASMWYVGLDWADTHHDVAVLDEAGKRVGAPRFAHSHAGLERFKQFSLSIAAQPEHPASVVETNNGLLISSLRE